MHNSTEDLGADDSRWPTTPILAYGTFGMRSPAGRRYHLRTSMALVVMALSMILGALFRPGGANSIVALITAIAPGLTFIYIVWEFRRYLLALDELARRIHFEAIACTYLVALPAAMLFGGLGLVYDWRLNALWFVAFEPVRAAWLYFISRRY